MDINTAKGGIFGLLIGDALGVPHEFKSPAQIPANISFELPEGYKRSHDTAPENAWSDDGALALCVLESLLEKKGFNATHMAKLMHEWYSKGHNAVDAKVFDIGGSTRRALENFNSGMTALQAGDKGWDAKGNGSLMRVLPVAVWHKGSDEELMQISMQQSLITHAEMLPSLLCGFYSLWARKITQNEQDPYFAALLKLEEIITRSGRADMQECLDREVKPRAQPEAGNTGYVLDAFNTARVIMCRAGNYEDAVAAAIKLGGDTDTNAAITGGLAGLKYGYSSINLSLRSSLAGAEITNPLMLKLAAHLSGQDLNYEAGRVIE